MTGREQLAHDLESLASDIRSSVSCGHSCMVAKPRGMATNGPCVHAELLADVRRAFRRGDFRREEGE